MRKDYILLVEDDDAIADVTAQVLTGEGYTVLRAANSETAISLFKQHQPNLIILDYVLPDGPPLKFLDHVRAKDHTPILLTTAASQSEAVADSLKIKNLLKKPFDIDQLLKKVKDCCPTQ